MADVKGELVKIPGGEFLMGSESKGDHTPVHNVYIASFYMDKHEVTSDKYLRFCEATGHRLPEFWGMEGFKSGPDYPNHPVIGVSWNDAVEYAAWCSKRLPTEAEWEYSARGGLAGMNFPNGETIHPSDGNYKESKMGGPVAVGSYPSNKFGLYDMQGNVVEWVGDFYKPDYYSSSPSSNPSGPEFGRFRVIRGGGWHSGGVCNSVYWRNALPPNWVDFNVGFRCAKDIK